MNAQSGIVKLPEESYEAAIRRFARGGAHIAGDDKTNPWVPFGEAAAIKHFCFDVRPIPSPISSGSRAVDELGRISTVASYRQSRWKGRGPTTSMIGRLVRAISFMSCPGPRTRSTPTIRME